MRLIKQLPHSDDCLACVAAMLCNTTPKDYKRFCKKNHLNRYYDFALISYIRKYHWTPGIFFKRINSLSINMKGIVCYLSVVSDNKRTRDNGDEHAVLWDGKRVLDPNPKVNNRPLRKYKILSIVPLCKVIFRG